MDDLLKGVVAFILIGSLIAGFVWLMANAPSASATLERLDSKHVFVCVEKYDWKRTNYYRECREWEGIK
jgi:hypothetical protein